MALKIWTTGETLTAADLNGNFFWNVVKKTSDQTKTSDTALAADSALQFSVAANTVYAFKIIVLYNTQATPDFKWDLDGPASPTNVDYIKTYHDHSGTGVASSGTTAFNSTITLTAAVAGNGFIVIEGILQNGSNAGTVSFRWAQNTSDAGATKVLKGSYLQYMII